MRKTKAITYNLDRVPTGDLIELRDLIQYVKTELMITAEQSGDDLNTTFLLHDELINIDARLSLAIMDRSNEVSRDHQECNDG